MLSVSDTSAQELSCPLPGFPIFPWCSYLPISLAFCCLRTTPAMDMLRAGSGCVSLPGSRGVVNASEQNNSFSPQSSTWGHVLWAERDRGSSAGQAGPGADPSCSQSCQPTSPSPQLWAPGAFALPVIIPWFPEGQNLAANPHASDGSSPTERQM